MIVMLGRVPVFLFKKPPIKSLLTSHSEREEHAVFNVCLIPRFIKGKQGKFELLYV
jgi:hypothetical protein